MTEIFLKFLLFYPANNEISKAGKFEIIYSIFLIFLKHFLLNLLFCNKKVRQFRKKIICLSLLFFIYIPWCYIYVVLHIWRIYELFKGKLIPFRSAFFIRQKNVSKSRWNFAQDFAELDCIRIYNVANMCVCVLQENVQNKRGK